VRIAVCIKRVPVMDRRFTIAASGTAIDEAGLAYDVNDFDLWAVEAALRLKEQTGEGEVVAISLGPDVVQEQIRKALSMGVDRAIHLQVANIPADDLAVAQAIADELRGQGFDAIFCGRVAVDRANGLVGPAIAEFLDMPCVTAVSKLEIANGRGRAQRELEGAQEIVEFPLPAVITVDQTQRDHGCQEEATPDQAGRAGHSACDDQETRAPP
jgi:electron transfer flavoprotein beta subunit